MTAFRTRGHQAAQAAVAAMLRRHVPHAILIVGPHGIGKTTLADDIAAGLLCGDPDPAERPCGTCRACRMVAGRNHPDVHRLGPVGAGRMVVIGGERATIRPGIRDLLTGLALAPVEGGARVAIVSEAHRMTEDAQGALLKTLEEPGADTTIILCADVEDPILPTIRSRSAQLRLGPVGVRDVEAVLAEAGLADPPLAARLARLANGRPGVAVAWARRPDAVVARGQLARTLLDLGDSRPAARLEAIRAAAPIAAVVAGVEEPAPAAMPPSVDPGPDGSPDEADEEPVAPARASAASRRRTTEAILRVWTDLTRDLVVVAAGMPAAARDIDLLDEVRIAAAQHDPDQLTSFLERLGRATTLLAGNVSPDLILDDLVLAWPGPSR